MPPKKAAPAKGKGAPAKKAKGKPEPHAPQEEHEEHAATKIQAIQRGISVHLYTCT